MFALKHLGIQAVLALSLALGAGCCPQNASWADSIPRRPRAPAQTYSGAGKCQAGRFDGRRALQLTSTQLAMGPRSIGSDGHARCVSWLLHQLRAEGLVPQLIRFEATTPLGPRSMVNVRAILPKTVHASQGGHRILLAAHYDTRGFPGWQFLGANDGASGVAVLLELLRATKAWPVRTRDVEFVFLDGEEAFVDWSATDSRYGSRAHVRWLNARGELRTLGVMVLVDMVGSRYLRLESLASTPPWLQESFARSAAHLGYPDLFRPEPCLIEDDHTPFADRGIATIDLIDFHYGPNDTNVWWHTPADTLDKLSADSMQKVGRLVEETLGVWLKTSTPRP